MLNHCSAALTTQHQDLKSTFSSSLYFTTKFTVQALSLSLLDLYSVLENTLKNNHLVQFSSWKELPKTTVSPPVFYW